MVPDRLRMSQRVTTAGHWSGDALPFRPGAQASGIRPRQTQASIVECATTYMRHIVEQIRVNRGRDSALGEGSDVERASRIFSFRDSSSVLTLMARKD